MTKRHHQPEDPTAALLLVLALGSLITLIILGIAGCIDLDDTRNTSALPSPTGERLDLPAVPTTVIQPLPTPPATVTATPARQDEWHFPNLTLPPPEPPPNGSHLIPPRDQWGTTGTTIAGRCTQWEDLLTWLQPDTGWDTPRMSGYLHRESSCCPQVDHGHWTTDTAGEPLWVSGTWHTTQGGDRFDASCRFSHVEVWYHRSDAGALQINGINYDPARCSPCLSDMLNEPVTLTTLSDPTLNIRAAAALCEWWHNAGSSCYRPWS